MTSGSFASRPAPPWAARAIVAAIGVLACLVYLAGGRLDIGTSAHDVAMTPALSPAAQQSFAADVPNGHRPSPSTMAARASLWMARGRRTALRDLAAVTSAAAIVLFGSWLHATGLPAFPVALSMLAMMMGPASWWRGVSWNGDALMPALLAGGLWAAWRQRWIVAGLLFLAAIVDGYDHAGLVTNPSAELSILGLCLAAIGVATMLAARQRRLTVVAAVLVTVALYAFRVTDVLLVLGGWAAVAVAIDWLQRAVPARAGKMLVVAVAAALIASPSLARVRLSALGRDLDSSLAARSAYDLHPSDLPAGAAMIAESRRVDSALALQSIAIVPQTAEAIDAAISKGTTLAAFPGAQANLERLGFLFERAWFGNTAVGVLAGRTPCVELREGQWQDVSMLVAARGFVLHGSAFGTAPGSATVRLTSTTPARVTAIEPRSIPYDTQDDDATLTIRVPRTGRRDPVIITLDQSPASAEASADGDSPVTLCPGPLPSPLMLGRRPDAATRIRMENNDLFARGWHPVEADPDYFRWTGADESIVRVTAAPPGPIRITVTATPASRAAQHPAIALRVNGCILESRPMPQGQADYEWMAAAACWRPGVNDVAIRVTPLISPAALFATHDTRLLGARVGAIRLSRIDQNAK